jgi:hypothetical protein
MSQIEFKLPIEFLDSKRGIDSSLAADLELVSQSEENDSESNPLYEYVFDTSATAFSSLTIPAWARYYTADRTFLHDTQQLMNREMTKFDSSYAEMSAVWEEMRAETGFCEKYQYIEWSWFEHLNSNAMFLQVLSMYNMASPLFSLALPVLLLILPFFLLRAHGRQVSLGDYFGALKHVLRNHQIGQLFTVSSASWDKRVYILISFAFYIFQIYQNVLACIRFYRNMNKIHYQLFVVREFVSDTVTRINAFENASEGLKTYEPFVDSLSHHKLVLETLKKELDKITPWSIGWKKFNSIGHIMYCYYQTCRSEHVVGALDFARHFTGYCDNLMAIRRHRARGTMNFCVFDDERTSFTKAYFPTIEHRKPVRNSYNLDSQLLITGPNAAGKTTILKTTIFNVLLCQQIGAGFFKNATIAPYHYIHCYINIPDTSGRDSLFQAEARRCKDILESIRESQASERHFCVFDELYSGTNPYEAIASAVSFLRYMNKSPNVSYVITTHFLDLCHRLSTEARVKNCHMATKASGADIKYTYKLKKGISSVRGGTKVLSDLEYPKEILDGAENVIDKLKM